MLIRTASIGAAGGDSIFCTDCHDSDDNREFGGTGPNGPHGSIYPHILERNYQFQPGGGSRRTVNNMFPKPDLSPLDLTRCARSATTWSLFLRTPV